VAELCRARRIWLKLCLVTCIDTARCVLHIENLDTPYLDQNFVIGLFEIEIHKRHPQCV